MFAWGTLLNTTRKALVNKIFAPFGCLGINQCGITPISTGSSTTLQYSMRILGTETAKVNEALCYALR